MALGFSQGLLGGLRTFGQGGNMPADPNQRNVMQQYGVTNPLLQQFGQSVGMLVGRDMRSNAAIQEEQKAQATQEAVVAMSTAKTPEDLRNAASKLFAAGKDRQAMVLLEKADSIEQTATVNDSVIQMVKDSGIPKEKQSKLLTAFSNKMLTAQDVYKELYPNRRDQLLIAGNNIFDTATGSFIPKPEDGKNPTNDRLKLTYNQISDLVTKGYDPENVQEFAISGDPTALGKPKDPKRTAAEQAATYKLMNGLTKADQALVNIEGARKVYENFGDVNKVAYASGYNVLGDVREMNTYLDSIKAALGFQALSDMRAASPTGGALGSVTEKENELLQAELAKLDPASDNFPEQLDRIQAHYENIRASLLGQEPPNLKTISGKKYWKSADGNWYEMLQGAE